MHENVRGLLPIDYFQDRYDLLCRWALQITDYDRELAQDIVHDIILQLLRRGAAPGAENPEGYFFAAIKNAYRTELRRKKNTALTGLSDDAGFDGALQFDPRRLTQIRDRLRTVCEYACARKSSSISGSVVLLRFFHGYYTSEVARILKRSVNAIEARLVKARREADEYLLASRKGRTRKAGRGRRREGVAGGEAADFLGELRRLIFEAGEGRCFSAAEWERVYRADRQPVSRRATAHLVSCPVCLETVRRLLDLPELHTRHPLDTLRLPARKAPLLSKAAGAAVIFLSTFYQLTGELPIL